MFEAIPDPRPSIDPTTVPMSVPKLLAKPFNPCSTAPSNPVKSPESPVPRFSIAAIRSEVCTPRASASPSKPTFIEVFKLVRDP